MRHSGATCAQIYIVPRDVVERDELSLWKQGRDYCSYTLQIL